MMAILRSALIVLAIAVAVGGATTAYFTDEETSTGNTFTAGTLDLTANDAPFSGSLNISNVAPSTTPVGSWEVEVHNNGNVDGAHLYFGFKNAENNENGCADPESDVDTACGATEGDLGAQANLKVYELGAAAAQGSTTPGTNTVYDGALGSYTTAIIGSLAAGEYKKFKFVVEVPTSVGNIIQSDSFSADMVLTLLQN